MSKKEEIIKILKGLGVSELHFEAGADEILALFEEDEVTPKRVGTLGSMGFYHHAMTIAKLHAQDVDADASDEKERGITIKRAPEFKISPSKFLNENQERKLTRKERREQERKNK